MSDGMLDVVFDRMFDGMFDRMVDAVFDAALDRMFDGALDGMFKHVVRAAPPVPGTDCAEHRLTRKGHRRCRAPTVPVINSPDPTHTLTQLITHPLTGSLSLTDPKRGGPKKNGYPPPNIFLRSQRGGPN